MSKEYPWGKGTPTWVRDATANDSDKSFTVPAGKVWDLKGIVYTIATTATAGNRSMRVTIGNGALPVWVTQVGATVAASLFSTNMVHFGTYASPTAANYPRLDTDALSGTNGSVQTAPALLLLPGYTVRVYDAAAIDAAADDLTVVLHYVEYDV